MQNPDSGGLLFTANSVEVMHRSSPKSHTHPPPSRVAVGGSSVVMYRTKISSVAGGRDWHSEAGVTSCGGSGVRVGDGTAPASVTEMPTFATVTETPTWPTAQGPPPARPGRRRPPAAARWRWSPSRAGRRAYLSPLTGPRDTAVLPALSGTQSPPGGEPVLSLRAARLRALGRRPARCPRRSANATLRAHGWAAAVVAFIGLVDRSRSLAPAVRTCRWFGRPRRRSVVGGRWSAVGGRWSAVGGRRAAGGGRRA